MFVELLSWLARQFIRRVGWPTLLALLLLLIALASVTLGLASAIRRFDTGLMLFMVGFGLLLGWGLGRSSLPGWLAALITLILGSESIALRVGQLGGPLLAFLQALLRLAVETWQWPLNSPPDAKPLLPPLTELWLGLTTLLIRLLDWSIALATGQPAFDPVATTLVWSLALWLIAAWAGWAVRRYAQPLLGLTPAGALLTISLAFAPTKTAMVPPLLGATLLVIALIAYQTREQRWQATGTDYPLDIRLDVTMAVLFLSAALVAVATITPSLSARQIAKLAQRLIGEQVAQARPMASSLGLEPRAGAVNVLEKARIGGLPRQHLLGSGPELSEQVVMVVQTKEPPPASPDQPPPAYYWRSVTYDQYSGHGWFTGQTQIIDYGAGEPTILELNLGSPVSLDSSPAHRILQQEVRVVDEISGLLYAAGGLITADQDFSVAWRGPNDIFGATIEATTYQAESLLPLASEARLRSAGSAYPAWVRQRYLALPDTIPNRVLTLARDLTATAPTPYDRATAIESYLRAFPYTLDLPVPPPNRDVVDYFLFDLQQGYCDYYASAMVVLARAAGLPARLAVGYITGTYDADQARYVVTEAEAHSWVEIYFPGYGWLNFEPTGGRPPIDRSEKSMPVVPPELEAPASISILAGQEGAGRVWWCLSLPAGLALVLLGGLAWSVADGWRLHRLPPAEVVTRLYRRLYDHGQRLDTPVTAGDTPYEFAASLARRLTGLASQKRWGRLLTPAIQEVNWLTDLYIQTRYSPHRPAPADQLQAIQLWRRLRRRLWLAWVYLFSSSNVSRTRRQFEDRRPHRSG